MNLKPLLKYPGGKGSELKIINDNLPSFFVNYIEPFVGGGAVYWNIEAKEYFINDLSKDLILLYEYIKNQNEIFFDELKLIDSNWKKLEDFSNNNFNFFSEQYNLYKEEKITSNLLNENISNFIEKYNPFDFPLFNFKGINKDIFKKQLKQNIYNKIDRIIKNEIKKNQILEKKELKNNIESAIKSAYYMHFREIYNNLIFQKNLYPERRVAIFLFIREYCFSSMFRFNSQGHFNVPYGGISYNKKNIDKKIEYYRNSEVVQKLNKTNIECLDFLDFLKKLKIKKTDFMFLDPPYDTEFTDYDNSDFNIKDQERLANYLKYECKCKFMLIIKKTDFIKNLYENTKFKIKEIKKNYFVSFKNRNQKNVIHLIITNY